MSKNFPANLQSLRHEGRRQGPPVHDHAPQTQRGGPLSAGPRFAALWPPYGRLPFIAYVSYSFSSCACPAALKVALRCAGEGAALVFPPGLYERADACAAHTGHPVATRRAKATGATATRGACLPSPRRPILRAGACAALAGRAARPPAPASAPRAVQLIACDISVLNFVTVDKCTPSGYKILPVPPPC